MICQRGRMVLSVHIVRPRGSRVGLLASRDSRFQCVTRKNATEESWKFYSDQFKEGCQKARPLFFHELINI